MTTSQITIHWGSGSPYAWRALLGLELKRVPYVSRLLEFSKGDTKSPEFRALNPRGKVPVLVEGDVVLRESLAILAYLDRRVPEPPLFGTSAAEAGAIWQDTLEVDTYLGAALREAVAPVYGGKGDADSTAAALQKVHDELGHYDDRLRDRPWLAGDRVSALDITVYPAVRTLLRAASRPAAADIGLQIDLASTHARVDAWRERFYALPGVPDTDPPHWR